MTQTNPTHRPLPRRTLRIGRLGLAGVISLAATTLASAGPTSEWSEQVWDAAQAGDNTRFSQLLTNVPPSAASITPSAELLLKSFDNNEQYRLEKIEEVTAELDEELAGADEDGSIDDLTLSQALVTAIELQILMDDRDTFFADERIGRVMAAGVVGATKAERHPHPATPAARLDPARPGP
ncbi:MAG: hypothetical protein AAGK04_06910, partial [Planctomycetota bacterium]